MELLILIGANLEDLGKEILFLEGGAEGAIELLLSDFCLLLHIQGCAHIPTHHVEVIFVLPLVESYIGLLWHQLWRQRVIKILLINL